ncbi:hypothetical protein SAMN05660642_01516 [Geodermatophilus siccatus]|uniref:Uncharacterized protein n=1 Tax=Geodermatophilus siccatus TaxID=1137991 RepID=A0A1G9Q5L9_9ACTN|nr:hypothetical protein SAMN05660642_01516 [Geodermatophilus siccatus]
MVLAETERLLRAARTGPLVERLPDPLAPSAHPSATEGRQEGTAASRGERPARWVPA